MRRCSELHDVKPSELSEQRAKAASPECIKKYFEELTAIIDRHGLRDKPQLIYNVDEKGIKYRWIAASKYCHSERVSSTGCDIRKIPNSYCDWVRECCWNQYPTFSCVSGKTFATRTI